MHQAAAQEALAHCVTDTKEALEAISCCAPALPLPRMPEEPVPVGAGRGARRQERCCTTGRAELPSWTLAHAAAGVGAARLLPTSLAPSDARCLTVG